MSRTQLPKPNRPDHDVPEEREQPELPVEPDEGLIPPVIPDDPEHERLVDPAAAVAPGELLYMTAVGGAAVSVSGPIT